jgi:hypothetical protein
MTSKKMSKEHDRKVVFYDTTKRHADLRIRLDYDGFTQSEFFRVMVTGYLEKDPRVTDYIHDYKAEKKLFRKQGKTSLKKTKALYAEGEETKKKFGLDEDTIESIFDLLEEEHPEL